MPTHLEEDELPEPATAAGRIDAVLFDYGLVLSGPPDPAAWARMRTITGLDEDALHAGYWEFRHDYDRAALTGREYWNAVGAHAGISLDDAQITAMYLADVDLWTVPNPTMIAWAAALQQAGIRTGILSNIGDAIADGIQARLPWLTGFDHCTWSHELSLAKPDPAIYILTAKALKTEPERILFVDDREDNIAAADKLGMHGVQYTSHAAFVQAMRARGFSSLLDVGSTAAWSAAHAAK